MTDYNNQDLRETNSKTFMFFHAFSFNGGPMLIQATIAAYFLVFMTDTMLLPASAAAMIMLIASVWDIVNDPIMGVIADKTNTRWGKYRPYFLFAPALYAIAAVALFWNPQGLTTTEQLIYVGFAYLSFGTLFTIMTMPHMAILPAVTRDNKYRNKVVTLGAIAMSASFTIGMSATPKVVAFFDGSYTPMMATYGIIGVLMYWGLFAVSKERYVTPKQKSTEKTAWTKELKTVLKCKEVYPIAAVWVFSSMGYALMFGSSVYYMMYFMKRPDLIGSYMGLISLGAFVSMSVGMPLALKLFRNGHKALYITQALTFISYTVLYFYGSVNVTLLFTVSFIATVTGGMAMGLINILVNDLIDFVQIKHGHNANGTVASMKGFCQKLGQSGINAGLLAALGAVGYVAGAIGHQNEAVYTVLNLTRFGVPAILCVAVVLLMKKYSLASFVAERDEQESKPEELTPATNNN